mgnify:FL=1
MFNWFSKKSRKEAESGTLQNVEGRIRASAFTQMSPTPEFQAKLKMQLLEKRHRNPTPSMFTLPRFLKITLPAVAST